MQPNSPVFFLDKNHGLLIRKMLKQVSLQVVAHQDMGWHHSMDDVEIIRECASRNYVILSGDKAMSRVPEERQAIIDLKCKVFMFEDSNKTRTEDWIAAVLVGRQRILDIVCRTAGPLFVTIKPCRAIGHIGHPEFVEKAGGKWILQADAASLSPAIAIEHPQGLQRKSKPRQSVIQFPTDTPAW